MKGKGYCMYPHLVAAQYKYNVSLLADEQLNPQFEQLGINCSRVFTKHKNRYTDTHTCFGPIV